MPGNAHTATTLILVPGALPKTCGVGHCGYVHKGDSDEFKPKVKSGTLLGCRGLLIAEGVLFKEVEHEYLPEVTECRVTARNELAKSGETSCKV